jgi:N-acetylmuramoyl-L-alanine amidase
VPTGIIIHHTATIPSKGKVPASASEVDQYHQTRGFNVLCFGREYHVAYHYLVLPDGKIQQGRPERCEGAHAPGYNSYLGISVAGDFSSVDNRRGSKGLPRPTQKQIKSLIELCRKLRQQYNIPLQHILRHSDVAPTKCPGDRFPFEYVVSQVARVG